MAADLLPSLLKAGGIAALAIGVVYLIYHEIIKIGVVPKLKQWQGFVLLCLLAILVFVLAFMVLPSRQVGTAMLDGELPPDFHIQADAVSGLFCESKNVRDDFASFFDYVEIGLSQCAGGTQSASRSYRIAWPPGGSRSVVPETRRNYRQCFVSDLAAVGPQFVERIERSFARNASDVPCHVTASVWRLIRLTYNDIRNQFKTVGFAQSYNAHDDKTFNVQQLPISSMARSDEMEVLSPEGSSELDRQRVLVIAREFHLPNVPR